MGNDRESRGENAIIDSARAAEEIAENPRQAVELIEAASAKAGRIRLDQGRLAQFVDDLGSVSRLLGSYYRREYTRLPKKTIVMGLLALFYFLNPFDILPDVFPLLGYIDDAAVVSFLVGAFRFDLETFRSWEKNRTAS